MTVPALLLAVVAQLGLPLNHEEVVDRAVVAKGLPKVGRDTVMFVRGTRNENGTPTRYLTLEELPSGRSRQDVLWTQDGVEMRLTWTHDGKRSWHAANGNARDVTDKELASMDVTNYSAAVLRLTSLKSDKRFTFRFLDDRTVGSDMCFGLRVQYPGRQDVDLYISKSTYLVRQEVNTTLGPDAKRYPEVTTYTDYKMFNGLHLATKQIQVIGENAFRREIIVEAVEFHPVAQAAEFFKKPKPTSIH